MPRAASFGLLLAILASGCGGAGSYSHGVYRDSRTSYRIAEPGDGFRRIESQGTDLAFSDDARGAVIEVSTHCDPTLDIPLPALTNQLLIGFTEREDVEEATRFPRDGRESLRTHVRAKLDGVPRELLIEILKKDGCVHDFVLAAPPGESFAATRPAFDRVVAGFSTETGRR